MFGCRCSDCLDRAPAGRLTWLNGYVAAWFAEIPTCENIWLVLWHGARLAKWFSEWSDKWVTGCYTKWQLTPELRAVFGWSPASTTDRWMDDGWTPDHRGQKNKLQFLTWRLIPSKISTDYLLSSCSSCFGAVSSLVPPPPCCWVVLSG